MKTMKTLDGIIYAVTTLVAEGEVHHACEVLAEGADEAKSLARLQTGSADSVIALCRLWDLFEQASAFLMVGEEFEGRGLAVLAQAKHVVPDLNDDQIEAIEKAMREEFDPHLGIHY